MVKAAKIPLVNEDGNTVLKMEKDKKYESFEEEEFDEKLQGINVDHDRVCACKA